MPLESEKLAYLRDLEGYVRKTDLPSIAGLVGPRGNDGPVGPPGLRGPAGPPGVFGSVEDMNSRNQRGINLRDYGFLPENNAAANDQALLDAMAFGNTFWIPEGRYKVGDFFSNLDPQVHIRAAGAENVVLDYMGTDGNGFRAPVFGEGGGKVLVQDVTIVQTGHPGVGVGINADGAQYATFERVNVVGFARGALYNEDEAFTAYVELKDCQFNGCPLGVRAGPGTNNCSFTGKRSRVNYSVSGGNGIGVDLEGVEAFSLRDVAIESADLCLRIGADSEVVVQGCYLEQGVGNRAYEIRGARKVTWDGNHTTDPSGIVVDLPLDAQHSLHGFSSTNQEVGISGTTAPYGNYIADADLSRNGFGWTMQNGATFTPDLADFLTGNRSLVLAPSGGVPLQSHAALDVEVVRGVEYVTFWAKIKNVSSTDFRVNVVNNGETFQARRTQIGGGWELVTVRVRLTDRDDRTCGIKMYPDVAAGNGQVKIDSVGLVHGSYAVPIRAYGEVEELLPAPILLYQETVNAGTVVEEVAPLPPHDAVGMILEGDVAGSAAADYETYVAIGARQFHTFANNRPAGFEYRVRGITLYAYLHTPNAANAVTGRFWIKGWVRRLT